MMQMKSEKERTVSSKIRKGDQVLVIAGNAKGQTGSVIGFKGDRVIVQGVNMRKKHVKPSQQNKKGGVIEFEAPIHISNVGLCDKDGNRLKVFVDEDASGNRFLASKNGSEKVIYRSLKKPKQ